MVLGTLEPELLDAGKRLIDALAAEIRTEEQRVQDPQSAALLAEWQKSRRAVERLANEYRDALQHYLDAAADRLP